MNTDVLYFVHPGTPKAAAGPGHYRRRPAVEQVQKSFPKHQTLYVARLKLVFQGRCAYNIPELFLSRIAVCFTVVAFHIFKFSCIIIPVLFLDNNNRVKLLSEPGTAGSDYINASFVSVSTS